MSKVFISYSRNDLAFIERLAADLEEHGCDVWYDISDLKVGDRWNRVIQGAIQNSQYVILVLSPNSVESKWVEKEYFYSDKLGKKIIPILYRSCELGLAYIDLHYTDVQGENYKKNFDRILQALNVAAKKPAPVGRIRNPPNSSAPIQSHDNKLPYAPSRNQTNKPEAKEFARNQAEEKAKREAEKFSDKQAEKNVQLDTEVLIRTPVKEKIGIDSRSPTTINQDVQIHEIGKATSNDFLKPWSMLVRGIYILGERESLIQIPLIIFFISYGLFNYEVYYLFNISVETVAVVALVLASILLILLGKIPFPSTIVFWVLVPYQVLVILNLVFSMFLMENKINSNVIASLSIILGVSLLINLRRPRHLHAPLASGLFGCFLMALPFVSREDSIVILFLFMLLSLASFWALLRSYTS